MSVFFCILPVLFIIVFSYLAEKPLVEEIKKASEILYTIVVLCGLTIYDLAATADRTAKYWWWLPALLAAGFWEIIGIVIYGVFLFTSITQNNGIQFLERIYPYSTCIAGSIIIIGMLPQFAIWATEKK